MSFEWDIKYDAEIRSITEKEMERINLPPDLSEQLSEDEERYLKMIIARQLNPTYADLWKTLENELKAFETWEENLVNDIDWDHHAHARKLSTLLTEYYGQKFLKQSYFKTYTNTRMYDYINNPGIIEKEYYPREVSIDELNAMYTTGKYDARSEAYLAESVDGKWVTLNFICDEPHKEIFVDRDMAIAWSTGHFDVNDLPLLFETKLNDYVELLNKRDISLGEEMVSAIAAVREFDNLSGNNLNNRKSR